VQNIDRNHRVYKSLNKPLTILGAERKLFFLAMVIGAATFNFFGNLMGGLFMAGLLYLLARWATATDPQLLRIIMNASKFRCRYDPSKWATGNEKG
jgi:type IV secretory pathway TrbD component